MQIASITKQNCIMMIKKKKNTDLNVNTSFNYNILGTESQECPHFYVLLFPFIQN